MIRNALRFSVICLMTLLLLNGCQSEDDQNLLFDTRPFDNSSPGGQTQLSKTSQFLLLIPDTQLYTATPEGRKRLSILVDRLLEIQREGFDIKAVLQVGDITSFNSVEEWESAKEIFSKLDTKIDYMLATGNHDYGKEGLGDSRVSSFNNYFDYSYNSSFVSSYQRNEYENTYFQFDVQGQLFQLFSLEFGPRDAVVKWADSIVKQHPQRNSILLTHAYLSSDLERYDFDSFSLDQELSPYSWTMNNSEPTMGNMNDGEKLWKKLVSPNNFGFVFCGHRTAVGNLISKNDAGKEVLQLIFADHRLPEGIEGWVQFLEFYDSGDVVGVKTYSTLLNTWKTGSQYQYEFPYKKS